jgi:proline dehydrogenase
MLSVLTKTLVNLFPKRTLMKLGERYLAGHSLEEGLATIEEYYGRGIYSSLDIVGEAAETNEEAEEYVESYIEALKRINRILPGTGKRYTSPVSVSVKPSSICVVFPFDDDFLTHPETRLQPQLEKIVTVAQGYGIPVTIDMEDHRCTSPTLDTAQEFWKKGRNNTGIVLQSSLYRSSKDIQEKLVDQDYTFSIQDIGVRLCLGIYREPKEIAERKKIKAKQMLLERAKELLDAGVYLESATHDPQVVRQIEELVKDLPRERREFQFLKGVRIAEEQIIPNLLEKGERVRIYMPIELKEGRAYPYMCRRLKESPQMVWLAARDRMRQNPKP